MLWAPQWRPEQKDVPKREVAAETSLKDFLQTSGCFKTFALRHLPSLTPAEVGAEVAAAHSRFNKMVLITLKELGLIIKLRSSFKLVDGGTEILL